MDGLQVVVQRLKSAAFKGVGEHFGISPRNFLRRREALKGSFVNPARGSGRDVNCTAPALALQCLLGSRKFEAIPIQGGQESVVFFCFVGVEASVLKTRAIENCLQLPVRDKRGLPQRVNRWLHDCVLQFLECAAGGNKKNTPTEHSGTSIPQSNSKI